MIYDENERSCIVFEKGQTKDGKEVRGISFYENYPVCEGDIDISNDEIYEVRNPYWLSDTFVFCRKHYDDVFLVGEVDIVCYIKISHSNQIEEIGTDFESRFGYDYETILEKSETEHATDLHKIIFALIGDEYWLKRIKESRK